MLEWFGVALESAMKLFGYVRQDKKNKEEEGRARIGREVLLAMQKGNAALLGMTEDEISNATGYLREVIDEAILRLNEKGLFRYANQKWYLKDQLANKLLGI